MGSLADDDVEFVARTLGLARLILVYVTNRQVRDAFSRLQSDCAQFEALVNAYEVGLLKIDHLLIIVRRMLDTPSRFPELGGEMKSLALLFFSLFEIDRCMQKGRWCMLSSSESLDLDVGNGRLSSMRFFLLREFFFSMDLARVALVCLIPDYKKHLEKTLGSPSQSRSQLEENFCNRPALDLFEWCETKRRPVLTQGALDLGQVVTQDIVQSYPGFLRPTRDLWTADPASESGEPSAQPSYSLPFEIDHRDVHDQVFLGHGSFGTVLRCSWHGKSAAMKIIQLDLEEPELQRSFEMEVRILASLHHPNIVPVFGYGYTERKAEGFFVMEHMQTDLGNIIRERRRWWVEPLVFPLHVAMDIMSQIVEGMCGLRRRRVIHRDLKPANILVNRPDETMGFGEEIYNVKLADFGSSNVRDDLDSVFTTLRKGTPAYMAPEAMSRTLLPGKSGNHGYSWKANVYSFGMVCAEILSGERPFRHLIGVPEILAAVRGGERPELPLDGGDPLRRLIEDCWKFKAEERPEFVEVRRRLWECKTYHFFTGQASTSWGTICALLSERNFDVPEGAMSPGVFTSSLDSRVEMETEQVAEELRCSQRQGSSSVPRSWYETVKDGMSRLWRRR